MLKMSMLTQKDYLTQCILYNQENGIMLMLKHATKPYIKSCVIQKQQYSILYSVFQYLNLMCWTDI